MEKLNIGDIVKINTPSLALNTSQINNRNLIGEIGIVKDVKSFSPDFEKGKIFGIMVILCNIKPPEGLKIVNGFSYYCGKEFTLIRKRENIGKLFYKGEINER